MTTKTTTTALLGFAVVAALLTGCTATTFDIKPSDVATAKPTASAPATAAPAAATVPTGTIVDEAAAHSILVAGKGQRAYPMADGTFVVVTKTEPVPAAVQADANAKAAATVAAHPDGSAPGMEGENALRAAEGAVAIGTGKRVIFVAGQIGYVESTSESKTYVLTVRGAAPLLGVLYDNRSDAAAAVDSFVASSDTPSEWIVIWGE